MIDLITLPLVTGWDGIRFRLSSELYVLIEDSVAIKFPSICVESFHKSQVAGIGFQLCKIGETLPVSIIIE